MNQTNNPTTNKGGRPRKIGKVHKWIVPPDIEELAERKGVDYIWTAAISFDRLMNPKC